MEGGDGGEEGDTLPSMWDKDGGRTCLTELHVRHVEHVSADALHARLARTATW